jgi:hypothetical protein
MSLEELLDALQTWTPKQLVEHLERFTSEELKPPAYRG